MGNALSNWHRSPSSKVIEISDFILILGWKCHLPVLRNILSRQFGRPQTRQETGFYLPICRRDFANRMETDAVSESRFLSIFMPVVRWNFDAPNVFRYHQPDSTNAGLLGINIDHVSRSAFICENNVNLDFHPHSQWNRSRDQRSMSVDNDC